VRGNPGPTAGPRFSPRSTWLYGPLNLTAPRDCMFAVIGLYRKARLVPAAGGWWQHIKGWWSEGVEGGGAFERGGHLGREVSGNKK